MTKGKATISALAALSLVALVFAGEQADFQDYARVLDVEAVHASPPVPTRPERCAASLTARQDLPVATSLTEDIRRQLRRWEAAPCRIDGPRNSRILGYRVTYRYRGHIASTLLSYDPGERVSVEISLSPLP